MRTWRLEHASPGAGRGAAVCEGGVGVAPGGSPARVMTGGGQTVGLLVVFVPLALWALLCLRDTLGWARDGRKTTHQSYVRNRAR